MENRTIIERSEVGSSGRVLENNCKVPSSNPSGSPAFSSSYFFSILVSTNIDQQLIWFADLSGRANKNLCMGSGMSTSLERTPCDIDVLGSNPTVLVSLTLVEIFQVTNNSSSEANLNHV